MRNRRPFLIALLLAVAIWGTNCQMFDWMDAVRALPEVHKSLAKGYMHLQRALTGFLLPDSLRTFDDMDLELEEEMPKRPYKTLHVEPQLPFENQEEHQQHRLLQQTTNTQTQTTVSCANGGRSVSGLRTVFKCGGSEVGRTEYNRRVSGGETCTAANTTASMCYCPKDFYGKRCETWNNVVCRVSDQNYTRDCNGKIATTGFVAAYNSGFPPCNFVNVNSVYTGHVNVTCRNRDVNNLNEGVKADDELFYITPNQPLPTFNYAINRPTLVSLFTLGGTLTTTVVNWNRLSSTATLKFPLSTENLASEALYKMQIPLAGIYSNYTIAGRITYFLDVLLNGTTSATTRQFMGFLEDEAYVPPPRSRRTPWSVIIIAVILSLAFVGLVVYCIVRWRKNSAVDPQHHEEEFQAMGDMRR